MVDLNILFVSFFHLLQGSFDQSQIIDENQFETFSNLVTDLHLRVNSDLYNKLEWFIKHALSTSLPSMGVDIGLLPNISRQVHDLVNKQETSKRILFHRINDVESSSSFQSNQSTLSEIQ